MALIKIFLFASLFLLMDCVSNKVPAELERQWMLVEFKDFTKQELVNNKASIRMDGHNKAPSKFSAFMGCNQIFFDASFSGQKKIHITNMGETLMFCDNMKLEERFSKFFPLMKSYSVEGHFLTLKDEIGNSMKFIAADWD